MDPDGGLRGRRARRPLGLAPPVRRALIRSGVRLRVGLVVERFEPGRGGIENEAGRVARGLAEAGDEVHVIARRGRPEPGVALHRVAVPEAWQPLRVLAFSAAAGRAAARGGYDVVYSLCRTTRQDVYGAGGGCHGEYLERRYAGAPRALRRLSPRHLALLGLERRALRGTRQRVVCNSHMVRRQLARRHGLERERVCVIRNGVDLARFHPDRARGARGQLRSQLSAGEVPVWLFAGSGFGRKGLDTALRALAAGGPEPHLWVAGADPPGPWRRLAARLGVAARVRFLGFRADVAELMAAADALLLPTRYDASAHVCLEAAASGRPVVTSGANGAAELFPDAGLTVGEPGDADGFAACLERLTGPALRERLGARARAAVESCSWEAHLAALREWLAGRRPAAPGAAISGP